MAQKISAYLPYIMQSISSPRCALCIIILLYTATGIKAQHPRDYLKDIIAEMKKEWPHNRSINLVFHGHSVPAGYFKTPHVNTLHAYPQLTLGKIKSVYPYSVVNVIVTAIGGENSESGAARFDTEVMTHRPDVLFIDYALNDRRLRLEKAKIYWEEMIEKALKNNVKVILVTPSPDQSVDITQSENILDQHRMQIIQLAEKYKVGLVDAYQKFVTVAREGKLEKYMSQINHPNEKGHNLIADEITRYFIQ